MEITNDSLPWSSVDEAHWNGFLQTETGRRLIPKVAERAPELLDGADVNKTLVRNGELRGFQEAIRALISLTHSVPEATTAQTENYPPLEDDAKWQDGQTLDKLEPKKDQ